MVLNKNIVNCTIVGDGMIGKTCLAKKFSGEDFSEDYVATIMDTFIGSVAAYGEKYTVNIQDTAGQFEDLALRESIYKKSDVCVICFSVVDRDSMESVRSVWLPEIREQLKKCPVILVATQIDLREESDDHVKSEEGKKLAKDLNVEHFIETSSFSHIGIKEVFNNVVEASVMKNKRKAKWMKLHRGS